ncbi:MAG TPA: adenosine kinase [Micavibrio sp.]
MSDNPARITCIGVCNVDVITHVDDDFLIAHNLPKGASAAVDAHKLGYLLEMVEHPVVRAGGSTANLACGLALRGLTVDFIGKIGGDTYGALFRKEFEPYQVNFSPRPDHDRQTSACLTLVTPDKERSFVFSTGTAGWYLKPADLPALPDAPTQIICIEANTTRMPNGYSAAESVFTAALLKYGFSNRRLFVGLNDREIINSARQQMGDALACPHVSFIGNVGEMLALFEEHDMALAFERAQKTGRHFVVTNGADGVYLIGPDMIDHVPVTPLPAAQIVDTIGAGDQFAAGYIAGIINGQSPQVAARAGIEAAREILKQAGGRPSVSPEE